jgi:hypothetical protein
MAEADPRFIDRRTAMLAVEEGPDWAAADAAARRAAASCR